MKPVRPVAKPFRPEPISVRTEEDLVRLCVSFMPARLVLAAARAGLFEAAAEPRTAIQIAAKLRTQPRATRLILDALAGMDLLRKRGGRYAASPLAARTLTRAGARSRMNSLLLWDASWEAWGDLPARLRGEPRPKPKRHWRSDGESNRAFIRAMYEMGWWNAQAVAKVLPTKGATRMVDLGGGPGHYALALAARNPKLRATIADLPLTLEVARETVVAHKMKRRFDFVACDLYGKKPLPLEEGAYDLALLSNVVHMEGAAENRALVKKIVPALRPGGRLVIHEFALDEGRARPQRSSLFAVHMLAFTERGELYPYREMASWMREAGLRPRLLSKEPFLTVGTKPK